MSSKADTKNMNQEKKHEFKPKLRFPEFWDAGDWEIKPLGKLGELVSGLTYSPEDVREKGLLVLRSSNVQNGEICLEDNVYVTPEIKGANLSKPNDILICVRNGSKALIGKNALVPEGMPLCTHGAFMTVFRSQSAKFIFQLFQTSAYQKQVDGDLGATINSINGSNFVKYKFYVPLSQEQQKIADCLSSISDRITLEAQKLDTLKAHKKGLMQQLFPAEGETLPKLRFPEFQDSGEWEEKKLGEVCDCIVPGRDKPKSFTGDIPWITIPDIQGLRIYSSVSKLKLSVDEIKECGAKIVPKNSVIMSCVGTFGLISICEQDLVINQQLHAWLPNPKINNYYLAYSLILQKKQMERMATNTTIAYLNKSSCNAIKIPLPALIEQQKIADCLSSLDELIAAQAQAIDTLKTHKKGLMQQLFPSVEEVKG